jgi:hypothetical protein
MVHLIKSQFVVKSLILAIALSFCSVNTNAQVELGIRGGGSNYLGDSSPIYPVLMETKLSGGLFLNVHLNSKIALKGQFNKYTISGNDANLVNSSTASRGLAFTTNLIDAGLAVQFYPYGLKRCEKRWTPYIFAGVAYMKYNTISSNFASAADIATAGVNESSVSIPAGLGIKKIIYKGLAVGAELQCAKTFTDQLDFPSYLGNSLYKDWYMFGGLTLSYVFGKKCDDDRRIGRNKAVPCPIISKNVVQF